MRRCEFGVVNWVNLVSTIHTAIYICYFLSSRHVETEPAWWTSKILRFLSSTQIHQNRRIQNILSEERFQKYAVSARENDSLLVSVSGLTGFVWSRRPNRIKKYTVSKVFGFVWKGLKPIQRVPSTVFQSRNPDPKFRAIP